MKLYGGGSPNAQKIVLMLEELGLAFDLIKVDVYGGEQYSPAFLALNPIGKYPVLIDGEGAAAGQPIFESCAILIYLAETYGPELLPKTGAARRSEEHTSALQSLMRISYAVFCLTKKKKNNRT